MEIILGVALAAVTIGFVAYSSLCIKHAARFRYLSARTVYLSLVFVAVATVSVMLLWGTYLWYVLS